MAYGLGGLILLLLATIVVGGSFDRGGGPFGLETQRRQLVRMLDASAAALKDAETAARDVDDSLESTASAAGSAGGFMTELAGTMRDLAASLRVSILGSQPFAGPADDFDRVAERAAAVAADLEVAASSVRLGAEDMAALADEMRELRLEVVQARQGLGNEIAAGRWRLLAAGFIAWFAVPAVVSLWVGFRWWRQVGDPSEAS